MPAPPKALLMSLHLESSCSETVHQRTRSRLRAANATPREKYYKTHWCLCNTAYHLKVSEEPTFHSVPLPKPEINQGSFKTESLERDGSHFHSA